MKKLICGLVIVMLFFLAGCGSRDTEVKTFILDSNKLASQIIRKVKDNPTPSGVDEAQKLLDGQKTRLKAKYDNLKSVSAAQVEEETMKKFAGSVFKNAEAVNGLRLDYVEQMIEDESFSQKIDQLIDDFNSIYEV